MIEFTYLFLFRCLSGAQNGFGYAKNAAGRTAATGVMIFGVGIAIAMFWGVSGWLRYAAFACSLVSAAGAAGVDLSFAKRLGKYNDVHLWEVFATGGVFLAWILAGGNLIYIFASVYPSLIIHKGFVNVGSGLKWWDTRTDDRTGKTFSIKIPWAWLRKLLGRDVIKVPRMGLRMRISAAVVSVLFVIINATSLQWEITVHDLVFWT